MRQISFTAREMTEALVMHKAYDDLALEAWERMTFGGVKVDVVPNPCAHRWGPWLKAYFDPGYIRNCKLCSDQQWKETWKPETQQPVENADEREEN